jgi:hypothetical protein
MRRIGVEIALGLLAIGLALVVLLPLMWAVDLIYHWGRNGEYKLLIAVVALGALLLLYQARLRPTLREPARRAAAGIVEALRGPEPAALPASSVAAFRTWGGVPIASLRASIHTAAPVLRTRLAEGLCGYVRDRAAVTGALTWALCEVSGDRIMLLCEPEQSGGDGWDLTQQLADSMIFQGAFHHLWSANGPASYEEPVAFATVLIGQAVSGKEADLHRLAVEMAERVAALPDIAGVEVLTSDAPGTQPPHFLWLAAGCSRSVRRQVYLALEPASAAEGLAWSIDRYDLLACDAYARLHVPAVAASAPPPRA